MIDIPKNDARMSMADFEEKVDEACKELVEQIDRQKRLNFERLWAHRD